MTTPLTPDQLAAIAARVPEGYDSPWTVSPETDADGALVWHVSYATDNPHAGHVAEVPDYGEVLAEFIAAARSDIPALLAEVKRLREQRAALIALHTGEELVPGGFYYCLHCTPDDGNDNIPWPCASLRAVGVTHDEARGLIQAHRTEIEQAAEVAR
jgi:hypothetical protein